MKLEGVITTRDEGRYVRRQELAGYFGAKPRYYKDADAEYGALKDSIDQNFSREDLVNVFADIMELNEE